MPKEMHLKHLKSIKRVGYGIILFKCKKMTLSVAIHIIKY